MLFIHAMSIFLLCVAGQEMIRQIFRLATQRIRIAGSEVIGVPLFESLNGKNSADYCQRVEPSAQGGEKMGAQLMNAISVAVHQHADGSASSNPYYQSS